MPIPVSVTATTAVPSLRWASTAHAAPLGRVAQGVVDQDQHAAGAAGRGCRAPPGRWPVADVERHLAVGGERLHRLGRGRDQLAEVEPADRRPCRAARGRARAASRRAPPAGRSRPGSRPPPRSRAAPAAGTRRSPGSRSAACAARARRRPRTPAPAKGQLEIGTSDKPTRDQQPQASDSNSPAAPPPNSKFSSRNRRISHLFLRQAGADDERRWHQAPASPRAAAPGRGAPALRRRRRSCSWGNGFPADSTARRERASKVYPSCGFWRIWPLGVDEQQEQPTEGSHPGGGNAAVIGAAPRAAAWREIPGMTR